MCGRDGHDRRRRSRRLRAPARTPGLLRPETRRRHDDDEATSEGIFVFHGDEDLVELGDLVRIPGWSPGSGPRPAQLPDSLEVLESGHTVTPTKVTMPFPTADYLERYEGMLVEFEQTLYVTEFFQLGRFGQIVVSSGDRLWQPTAVVEPGPGAAAMQEANNLNRLIVDDHENGQNPDPILFGRGGDPLTAETRFAAATPHRSGRRHDLHVVGQLPHRGTPIACVVGDLSDSGLVPGGVVPNSCRQPEADRTVPRSAAPSPWPLQRPQLLPHPRRRGQCLRARRVRAGVPRGQQLRRVHETAHQTAHALSKLDVDVIGPWSWRTRRESSRSPIWWRGSTTSRDTRPTTSSTPG